jgi:hypothetical protein
MEMQTRKSSWVVWTVALVLYTSTANAALIYTEAYEMNSSPTALAGTTFGNVLFIADPTGNGTFGPEGWVYSAGIGEFLDDANSSGNQGLAVGTTAQAAWLQGSSNYSADMRIQVLADQQGSAGRKSMSFWSGNGRGLQIDTGGATFVNGSGPSAPGGGHNFGVFDTYRVIINGATNTADLYYSLDGDVNNGNNDNVLLTTTAMGGSGFWGGSTVGFALGSTAGSSTTLSHYYMDYFRVYSGGTNPNAVYSVPEPAMLAMLVLGSVPMVMRRRR